MNSSIKFRFASIIKETIVTLSTVLIILILIGCSYDKYETEAHNKKEQFYSLPGLKHGLLQSPINILSDQSEKEKHNVTFNFKDEIDKVQNLGHTVQLDFKPGSTVTVDGKTFEFKQ